MDFGHPPLHLLWEILQAEWYKRWNGSLENHTTGKASQPIRLEDQKELLYEYKYNVYYYYLKIILNQI